MAEEEKPPKGEAKEKTLVVPAPAEKPKEGPARTRTAERKLQPSPSEPTAPARTQTIERRLQPSPPEPTAPARTQTAERTVLVSTQQQAGTPRTRTQELRALARAERPAESKAVEPPTAVHTLPGAPAPAQTDIDAVPTTPELTVPREIREGKAPQPAGAAERTIMVPFPEPPATPRTRTSTRAALQARPASEEPRAAADSTQESPANTLPGGPVGKEAAKAGRVERTVMVPFPEEPPQPSPPSVTPPVAAVKKTPLPRQPVDSVPEQVTDFAHTSTLPPGTRKPAVSPDPVDSQPQLEETDSLVEGMKLGGYQLIHRLGVGGMGTVWLASQLSLDREVAVKILRPEFAGDPQFVLRFTQEAFAAAQLIHHNIVQIYDCGSDKQFHFFSMEYVDAQSLRTMVRRQGSLDPEVAAGYILQAARGLQFAHDRGMVHRDIKPDNLLLNNNGIVKVADLGLVKLANSARKARAKQAPLTYVGKNPSDYAMGTPAYMAPEQVQDSSKVDARADIYSLGCTLYHLLTGRPPFMADLIPMVMEQHVKEPPVAPDKRNPNVPEALSAIVMQMLAKRPEDRFQNMAAVIEALEGFLGFDSNGAFGPREQHANLLEHCVQEFTASRWALWRRRLVLMLTMLAAVVTGVLEWRLGPPWGLGVAAFTASAWLSSFIVRGVFEKGALFLRCRQFVFQAPLFTWLVWLLMLGGAGYGLYRVQLILPTIILMGSGLLFALGFYVFVDRKVDAERRPPVSQVEQMLRSMRLRGLEESSLRQFVCTYSGEDWEGFYEALFGYDAKMVAREKWGLNNRDLPREQHSAWRDPLIRWMDFLQDARRRRRERQQLRMLERKKAKAQLEQARAQEEDSSSPE
ncbi:serine/threonine-protein kinase [Hyalangium versicolor]|uniref:serine/threonine-protein kinase n=1 Tax=Hyalangium versicolor TaxID=2861190 RepID=UPI001CC9AFDC|nr:serine/threonine-protein kinase [Hyalangium versicolor]